MYDRPGRAGTAIGLLITQRSRVYAAGQDQAPAALREAGLIDALTGTGPEVRDAGDLPEQVWRPDRERPFAQNAG
jgi:arginase